MKKLFLLLILVAVTGVLFAGPLSGDAFANPAGQVYDVWFKSSFTPPLDPPFHDCLRFNAAGTQATIDGLGTGIAAAATGQAGLWLAIIPVTGTGDYFFVGTFLSLGENDAIAASATTIGQNWTFGGGGQENPTCVLYLDSGWSP